MPKLSYFTPAEQSVFQQLNKACTYGTKQDATLNGTILALPRQYLEITYERCPIEFYENLKRRPLQRPKEYLIEVNNSNVPSLRFYDFVSAAIHEKDMNEATIGLLMPDNDGKIDLPIELIVKASLREAKPKGKLIAGPFTGYDTFGIWIPQFYEKAISKKKD